MAAIFVHGGAGSAFAGDEPETYQRACMRAAIAGHVVLTRGGTAVEAVVAATVVLEDDPLFNAGVGSVLNQDGDVEMDALVMRGRDLAVGGVAALRAFRNPILVSREVLEHSPHILLAAEGAARFAQSRGLTPCNPDELITERSRRRWAEDAAVGEPGTVGAVAVDGAGSVAAANSTGGIYRKLAGRIGDTPLVGGGTYADDRSGAAAATGFGEGIARVVMAKVACDHLADGDTPTAAARAAVRALERVNGRGGIILVAPSGRLGAAFNTDRMSRAWIDIHGNAGAGFGLEADTPFIWETGTEHIRHGR